MAGQFGVIGQVAGQVVLRGKVKGTARRVMTMAAALRRRRSVPVSADTGRASR
jgi:hypothetical protein